MFTIQTMTKSAKAQLAYAKAHGKVVLPLIQAMEKSGTCGLTNAYVADNDFTLSIIGGAQEMGAVWHILRSAGFECSSDRPKANQPSWSGWFRNGDTCIYLSFTSSICKRVKTGTKTVEVDTYDIVCGEE